MKKIFFAALIAVAFTGSAFAAGSSAINYNVATNFKTTFKGATDVQWTVKSDFVKATFVIDNQRVEAFYKPEGEMIGTATAVTIDQLPLSAKRSFAKKYSGYNVTEAIHFEGAEENAYYISAENGQEKVIIKVGENNQVSVFSKTSR